MQRTGGKNASGRVSKDGEQGASSETSTPTKQPRGVDGSPELGDMRPGW